MYSVRIDRAVLKSLTNPRTSPPKVGRRIALKMLSLSADQCPADCKQIGDGYRVDSGEYRIYYDVDDEHHLATVWLVGKRNDFRSSYRAGEGLV
jgi:mRNA-degrading endonuclease RelE of RelBE toxin-antitoxin system